MSATGTIRPPTSEIPIATGRTAAPFTRLLASELWWMLRRPRTLVLLGVLAVIPVLLGVGMAMSGEGPGDMLMGLLEGSGTLVGLFALFTTMALLLPLLISVVAADSFAGEASAGTLRGLLLAPVSRGMLVLVKTISVFIFAAMAVGVVVVVGVVTGLVTVGGDAMITTTGTSIGLGESLARMALIAAWATLQMWAVAAVALAVSAATQRPIVVSASVMGVFVGFQLITGFPQFDWLHPAVLTHRWLSTQTAMLGDPMDFTDLQTSALRACFYLLIGLSLTVWRVNSKDQ